MINSYADLPAAIIEDLEMVLSDIDLILEEGSGRDLAYRIEEECGVEISLAFRMIEAAVRDNLDDS